MADGRFSGHANTQLKAGDTLAVMPRQGGFVAPPVAGAPRLFLGGSGITPVIAILKDLLEREPLGGFVLLYGNRSFRDSVLQPTGSMPKCFMPASGAVARPPALAQAENSAHQAHIRFDGRTHRIPVVQGESIIDAAARAGLELPFSCKGAMCCTCRAKLTSGKVDMVQNFSLEPWEVQSGFVLACQALPVTAEVALDFGQV